MSAWQVIKQSFRDFYKHLFQQAAVSLVWFMTVAPLVYIAIGGIAIGQPVIALPVLIVTGPLTIASFYLTNRWMKFEESVLKDWWTGLTRYFFRGMLAFWLSLLIFVIIVVDLFFFLNFGNRVLQLLAGIWIYLGIFFLISQFYFWSLLVERDLGILVTLKDSFLLTLDNLLYSLGIFGVFALLTTVGIVTAGVGLAVSFIGFLGILANNATYNLMIKYGLRRPLISPYAMESPSPDGE